MLTKKYDKKIGLVAALKVRIQLLYYIPCLANLCQTEKCAQNMAEEEHTAVTVSPQ